MPIKVFELPIGVPQSEQKQTSKLQLLKTGQQMTAASLRLTTNLDNHNYMTPQKKQVGVSSPQHNLMALKQRAITIQNAN